MQAENTATYAAILPAGGLGKRLGADLPKQLLALGGKPIYRHSLDLFWNNPHIVQIVVAVPAEWRDYFSEDLRNYDPQRLTLVNGGAERWQSVRHGIEALAPHIDYALVHDVARPLLSAAILQSAMEQVRTQPCIVAKPCADTVKIVAQNEVRQTIDRNQVWLAQTPQAASVKLFRELYARMDGENNAWNPTDEASILEYYGIKVAVVPGNNLNDKITTSEDLDFFRQRLNHE